MLLNLPPLLDAFQGDTLCTVQAFSFVIGTISMYFVFRITHVVPYIDELFVCAYAETNWVSGISNYLSCKPSFIYMYLFSI